MISVERVLDYTKLEPEAALESTDDKKPPSDWPKHGEIVAENVNFRYTSDGPIVLKKLNFKINAQEKVNIDAYAWYNAFSPGKSISCGCMAQWAAPLNHIWLDVSSSPSKSSHCFLKQEMLPSLLSTGWLEHNLDNQKLLVLR